MRSALHRLLSFLHLVLRCVLVGRRVGCFISFGPGTHFALILSSDHRILLNMRRSMMLPDHSCFVHCVIRAGFRLTRLFFEVVIVLPQFSQIIVAVLGLVWVLLGNKFGMVLDLMRPSLSRMVPDFVHRVVYTVHPLGLELKELGAVLHGCGGGGIVEVDDRIEVNDQRALQVRDVSVLVHGDDEVSVVTGLCVLDKRKRVRLHGPDHLCGL
mmetsp:Transcript_29793/g.61255  ORF Transcript_29793/g.61255 Transcript_29793/m.61255 type:complete len:212 (+) Transcript_29793:3123-3758(+)